MVAHVTTFQKKTKILVLNRKCDILTIVYQNKINLNVHLFLRNVIFRVQPGILPVQE